METSLPDMEAMESVDLGAPDMAKVDPCASVTCPPGETCAVGADGEVQCLAGWVDDLPTPDTDGGVVDAGPDGGMDTPDVSQGGNPIVDPDATSGGTEDVSKVDPVADCSCRLGSRGAPSAALLLGLLAIMPRRRRRGR